jgi:hypothetical protein
VEALRSHATGVETVKLAANFLTCILYVVANSRQRAACGLMLTLLMTASSGCSLIPEARTRDSLHNPFPQLKRVAVLPFFNQSDQPSVDGDAVAKAYYAALQAIPGFEVLPVGVTAMQWRAYAAQYGEPRTGAEFQRLAQMMDVEAIVVGSVTDFDAYYPPRMAMTVHWYAANEGFHAIPAGYGLPWGTEAEDKIPARIAREAEFELARSQLKTQSPVSPPPPIQQPVRLQSHEQAPRNELRDQISHVDPTDSWGPPTKPDSKIKQVQFQEDIAGQRISVPTITTDGMPLEIPTDMPVDQAMSGVDGEHYVLSDQHGSAVDGGFVTPLPANWPQPADLIPDPPQPVPPVMIRQHEPVLSHTRLYRGDDPYFTARLADYVETGDDARGMSWQGYVKRSEDFIRFCCHLHIVEMLEARGGQDPSDLILRWPVSRY